MRQSQSPVILREAVGCDTAARRDSLSLASIALCKAAEQMASLTSMSICRQRPRAVYTLYMHMPPSMHADAQQLRDLA